MKSETRRNIGFVFVIVVTVILFAILVKYGSDVRGNNIDLSSPHVSIGYGVIDLGSKKVMQKLESIENRISMTEMAFGQGSVTKSQTIYYLASEDGTVCEVGMSDYLRVKVGDMYEGAWKQK